MGEVKYNAFENEWELVGSDWEVQYNSFTGGWCMHHLARKHGTTRTIIDGSLHLLVGNCNSILTPPSGNTHREVLKQDTIRRRADGN